MDLLIPGGPVLEKLIRPAVVYLFLLLAFRLAGKRQLGQMTAFDLVVLLLTADVVQNSMIGDDTSLSGGLISASAIFLLNAVVAWITYRFRRAERLVDPGPTVLVRRGKLLRDALRREQISPREFRAALRREGVVAMSHVHWAVLEETGHVSVILKKPEADR